MALSRWFRGAGGRGWKRVCPQKGSPHLPDTRHTAGCRALCWIAAALIVGCGGVHRPRRHATACCVAVSAPVRSHRSRQPSAPPFEKYGVERPRRGQTEADGRIFEPPDAQEARRRVANPRPPSIHLPGEAGRATRQARRYYRRVTCQDAFAQVCTESGATLVCTKFAQPVFLHTICTRFSSRDFPQMHSLCL